MKINNVLRNMPPIDFFGLKTGDDLYKFGMERLGLLHLLMQQKYNFAGLGVVFADKISNLRADDLSRPQNLADFKNKKLAWLTINGEEFRDSNLSYELGSHTIGLVINENPNQYFYKTNPQIIIMDSFGNELPFIKKVHQVLIDDFISKEFPGSEIIINTEPQQTENTLSCFNWAMANLKIARENYGRTDLINLLPKSSDYNKILEEQKQLLLENYL